MVLCDLENRNAMKDVPPSCFSIMKLKSNIEFSYKSKFKVQFLGLRFICGPYLAIKLALALFGPDNDRIQVYK